MSKNTERPIICLSYFTAREDQLENLINALSALIEPTRRNKECLQYELVQDIKNPNLLIMIEKFTSQQALANHENQPHIKSFVENDMDRLCSEVTWHEAKEVTN